MGTKCTIEDKFGKTWKTKVKTLPTGRMCLDEGWEQFHNDHKLNYADFLTFHLITSNHFFVRIFDESGCAKVYQQPSIIFNFVNKIFNKPCFNYSFINSIGQEMDDASTSHSILSLSFK